MQATKVAIRGRQTTPTAKGVVRSPPMVDFGVVGQRGWFCYSGGLTQIRVIAFVGYCA